MRPKIKLCSAAGLPCADPGVGDETWAWTHREIEGPVSGREGGPALTGAL